MLESRGVREGHTGGAYSAPTAGQSAPANPVPDFSRSENPFGQQIHWTFQMMIYHSNGQLIL